MPSEDLYPDYMENFYLNNERKEVRVGTKAKDLNRYFRKEDM